MFGCVIFVNFGCYFFCFDFLIGGVVCLIYFGDVIVDCVVYLVIGEGCECWFLFRMKCFCGLCKVKLIIGNDVVEMDMWW